MAITGFFNSAEYFRYTLSNIKGKYRETRNIRSSVNHSVGMGANKIGTMMSKTLTDAKFEESMRTAKNTFGDGEAGERIVDLLRCKGGALI
ncbi:MAG: hypothetical protein U9N36_06235 [Euryarchaeota archaeon]|nr:hypothetical protein [Euryarchaeota archaeon]